MLDDPALLGSLLALVYGVAALAQVVVGRLLDRFDIKPLFLIMVLIQIPLLLLVSVSHGWMLYVALLATMMFILGQFHSPTS